MDDILIERPKVDSQPDDKTETSDISKNLVTPGTNKGWVIMKSWGNQLTVFCFKVLVMLLVFNAYKTDEKLR